MLKFWRSFKWLLNPISILVIAQICWGLLMFVWIRWYILRSQEINTLIERIPLPAKPSGQWVILAQGCLLMAFILFGLYMIFLSQRRLFRLTKMQDAILSTVTHELKTPLASIRLYAETMLLRDVPENQRKVFLQRTLSESDRLQRLIDTVLISARLESDKSKIAHGRADLTQVLETCVSHVRERFSAVRSVEFFLPQGAKNDSVYLVWGNTHHLSTLFDNLLDNAVKYTEKNGMIQVGMILRKENLIVYIKDNGFGIKKNNLKEIFKKFYRAEADSKIKVSGSGLGLSICRSIVREHGGKIYASSEGLNKGSTFYVELKRFSPHH